MKSIASLGGQFKVLIFIGAALVLFSVLPVYAAPLDVSTPPDAFLTADDTFSYSIMTDGISSASLTYTLTHAPVGMAVSQEGVLTWDPEDAGDYRVVLGITDGNDGYSTKAFRITVTPGNLAELDITPNDKPTQVSLGETKQFTSKGYDADGNSVSVGRVAWTTAGDIGSISSDGIFSADRSAIGEVIAHIGDIKKSIGVSVTGTHAVETPLAPQGQVLGEATEEIAANEDGVDEAEDNAAEEVSSEEIISTEESSEQSDDECINWEKWIIIFLVLVYTAILIWYYGYLKRRYHSLWWLFPIVLTILALIVYTRYICEGTYLWWPWSIIIIGVVLTTLFQPRGKSQDSQE
ncbi:putative Ig domain-containing protein [Patescibacteria group bacterium]